MIALCTPGLFITTVMSFREVFMHFSGTRFPLNVAVFAFTMRSNFTFLTFQKREKTSKSGIIEILTLWCMYSRGPEWGIMISE